MKSRNILKDKFKSVLPAENIFGNKVKFLPETHIIEPRVTCKLMSSCIHFENLFFANRYF